MANYATQITDVGRQILLALKKRYDLNLKQEDLIFELGGLGTKLDNENDYLDTVTALDGLKNSIGIDYVIERTYTDRRGRTRYHTLYESRLCKIKIVDKKKFEQALEEATAIFPKNHSPKPSVTKVGKVTFLDKEATLTLGDKRCSLPPYKNEHFLCRAMFKHPKGKPIDWSEAFEEITGYYEESYGKPPKTKANYHRVYDPARQINQRVKKDLGVDELFRWRELTITRLH